MSARSGPGLTIAAALVTLALLAAPSASARTTSPPAPEAPARSASAAVPAASGRAGSEPPETVVLDGGRLLRTRARLAKGDHRLARALRELTARADNWLDQGPWTVVDKPRPAPGGDVHDYLSQAPYWWPSQPPTADNPWGCPYVQRDGQRNPEVDTGTDRQDVEKVFDSTYDLALAWYYTGEKRYAVKAGQVLRTWFLDPATRMNPNLDHGQFIPCKYDGRAIGIIDFSQSYTSVLDAIALLDTGAPGWSRRDRAAMLAWNTGYRDWLKDGAFGKEEGAARNNHGTFYDMQLAALACATGDKDLARRTVLAAGPLRVDPQIAPDGGQPQELARTRSWHYSTFDLVAYTRLAAIGRKVGVDLWAYRGPDGQSLTRAVDYLLPAATAAEPWNHPELEFHRFAASDVVHAAADAGDRAARAAVPRLEAPPGGDLWELRPAAEQLDSIAG
ncbi:alginate lyase family protein [Streptomyces sp. NPDC001935]|uniref:alginate lyase family protein n=1 Tax=Streptomyces sp. NPDC056738 TaxID=3345933 RepID=UPI0036926096